MVFVYTAMGVLCVEHANVLELCYIELLSGDSSPYSILSDIMTKKNPQQIYVNHSLVMSEQNTASSSISKTKNVVGQ